MAAEKAGDVRTQGNDAQLMSASKIQRGARQLRGQSLVLKGLRHFGVLENNAVGEAAIGYERREPIDGGFEPVSVFVMSDDYVVQI